MVRKSTAPARTAPHEVRIIGGIWKRTRLPVLDRPGLRPTPDRVRETLFNWLGHDLTGWRCVDAFAGTGALGLEAASRGAAEVLLVESEGELVDQLRGIAKRLQAGNVRVQRGNALSVLAGLRPASVDLVFIDPPFDSQLFDKALAAARPALVPAGFIYLEAPVQWSGEALERHGLEAVRHLKAGAVHGHLLRPVA
ncbi:MAG: methyltransferase-like protein [Ramlibacter sp.]|jgi:16S rRNA (guanine966-N2)-methyltransferase|uniref:16S rRNA (guanine(966)-N(2))-methyltransferase RsmD n=1 Tax=Ramlibacter sp. TaxID=1917967 RepID=UPI002620630A|nr:16S rRNA (guanine(966)-N(2))-methyltransferase RsmD [Ramlibacter sp.]MDB5752976.1 methyltransferase-like protein [Ramlibacter sp.]